MKMSKQGLNIFLVLFLLPLVGFWIYTQFLEPSLFFAQMDPELAYFIDSLNVFKGNTYGFYQHPGTPVDLLGSMVFGATYPFIGGSANSFVAYHLGNPRIFLVIARTLLAVGSMITILVFAKRTLPIKHWTDALIVSALASMFFAIFPFGFTQILTWSHNSFSFPVGAFTMLLLYIWLKENQDLSTRQIIILGILSGVLSATQLYFATWVIGVMITITIHALFSGKGWKPILRQVFLAGMVSVAAFIVVTLPIYKLYPTLVDWIIGILTHQGDYGGGPEGFASPQLLLDNFRMLFRQLPVLITTAGVAILALIITLFFQKGSIKDRSGLWSLGFGLSGLILITLVIILKHPNVRYLQTIAALLPILIAVLLNLLQPENRDSAPLRLFKFSLALVIMVGLAFNLYQALVFHQIENRQIRAAAVEIEGFIESVQRERPDDQPAPIVLFTYGTPNACFSLRYGSSFSENGLAEEIDQKCPRLYKLELWSHLVYLPDGELLPVEKVDWDLIVTSEGGLGEYPGLKEMGDVEYSDTWVPSFGKIVYITALD